MKKNIHRHQKRQYYSTAVLKPKQIKLVRLSPQKQNYTSADIKPRDYRLEARLKTVKREMQVRKWITLQIHTTEISGVQSRAAAAVAIFPEYQGIRALVAITDKTGWLRITLSAVPSIRSPDYAHISSLISNSIPNAPDCSVQPRTK